MSYTDSPRSVMLNTKAVYATAILKMARISTLTVAATSSCSAGQTNLEIALVLDTTGSMNQSAGSVSKIEALKTAATNFVNTIYTQFDASQVKVSIVPFAAAVRVDPATYAPSNNPSAAWLDSAGMSGTHWHNVLSPIAAGFTNRFGIFKKLAAANSSWTWAGCLEALPYPYNTQDALPTTATPNTLYVPLLAPDEVSSLFIILQDTVSNNSYMDDGSGLGGSCDSFNLNKSTRLGQACKYNQIKNKVTSQPGPNWGCTSRALTKLTNSKTTLLSEIGQLAASGQTNIAEGLHWGWRTVSKTGVFTEAADYGTAGTTKVIVLMTDGVNTWSSDSSIAVAKSQYSAYGYFNNADGTTPSDRFPAAYGTLQTDADARAAMDQVTRETCTNAKAKGVVVYSVAFSTPGDTIDASGQQLIKDCASSADKFFLASDASSLDNAFAGIARGIGELRLTR